MTFQRSRSSCQIDRGLDMKFHPLCGRPILSMCWDGCGQYYYQEMVSSGGWSFYEPGEITYYPRIGDGLDHEKGEPYLAHWTHDPTTGKPINRT